MILVALPLPRSCGTAGLGKVRLVKDLDLAKKRRLGSQSLANLRLVRMRSIVIVAFTVASICGFVLETDRLFYEMKLGM